MKLVHQVGPTTCLAPDPCSNLTRKGGRDGLGFELEASTNRFDHAMSNNFEFSKIILVIAIEFNAGLSVGSSNPNP